MDTKSSILESRIRELERALDIEKKANNEYVKQLYKKDRKLKQTLFEAEDTKQKLKDVQQTVLDLESDIRIYRRKLDESQEICGLNQTRFRKVHQMYLSECGKSEEYGEQLRRRRAQQEKTSLFVQV